MRRLVPAWPLFLLAAVAAGVWLSGGARLLPTGTLGRTLRTGEALAAGHPVLAALAYVTLYAVLVGASIPAGLWLSLAGGAVFGPVLGTALAATGATVGATLLFLLARWTAGAALGQRHGALLARIRPRLERDGFAALLATRLVPIVPFWLTNLAAALVGFRLLPFVVATAIGILPATAVFVSAGAGLGDAVAGGAPLGADVVLRPAVLLPLAGQAMLALLPVAVRQLRRP